MTLEHLDSERDRGIGAAGLDCGDEHSQDAGHVVRGGHAREERQAGSFNRQRARFKHLDGAIGG